MNGFVGRVRRYRLLTKVVEGCGEERDVDLIDQVAKQGEMRTICALFDGCAMPVRSYIPKFREDFLQLVKRREPGDGKSLPVVASA